jgi:hypothetical protein
MDSNGSQFFDNSPVYDIVQIESPPRALQEVHTFLKNPHTFLEPGIVRDAFQMTVDLYNGDFPGYRACNTQYHDLRHTVGTFLAMGRMIHGGILNGLKLDKRMVSLGLLSALFHDTGYIQTIDDTRGTGGKYTVVHVNRSIDFLEKHGTAVGMSPDEISAVSAMILYTDIQRDVSEVPRPDEKSELLGKMLAAADLLSQMADRIYLEKLLYLYYEFKEGEVGGYSNEEDLLRQTPGFYRFIDDRLEKMLGNKIEEYMRSHFNERWDKDQNLYRVAIQRQRRYLINVLDHADNGLLDYLRRAGIVEKFRRINR